ncbi:MAG: CinA family protein [Brachybacterium sp.]|nr:CinA family protein [Brachybacterium sp.]
MNPAVSPAVQDLPREIIARAVARGWMIATAESLTGGLLVARLVDVPGASHAVAGGTVCYSLEAKHRLLELESEELERTGAVTAEVALAMADGARRAYDSQLAIATTGVAGPGPDDRGVPAGTVHLALVGAEGLRHAREVHLDGDRDAVRAGAVEAALRMLHDALADLPDQR